MRFLFDPLIILLYAFLERNWLFLGQFWKQPCETIQINNMDIQKQQLSTADEYTKFVREFATLLDEQLSVWEDRAKNKENLHELAR